MVELLAALSASAAVGMRVMLPLLLIGLLSGTDLWQHVPVLSHLSSPVLFGILVSGSAFEVLVSKERLGRRLVQILELLMSPFVGAIASIAVITQATDLPLIVFWLLGLVGGLLSLVLHLVQVGWFYRLRGLPTWCVFTQDLLCVLLIFMAFGAPQQGGLIALVLLWLAIRSSTSWQRWQRQGRILKHHPEESLEFSSPPHGP
ncbi:MAG: DUF4126 domain-containing protein [Synechococcales bacterium]|nr:DUF4126 domain-containing protein [Synechococcales bacterium]